MGGKLLQYGTTVPYDRTANIPVSPDKQIRDLKRVHETRLKAHPFTDVHTVPYRYSYITEQWWEVTSRARVRTIARVVRCGIALCAEIGGSLGITRIEASCMSFVETIHEQEQHRHYHRADAVSSAVLLCKNHLDKTRATRIPNG